MLNVIGHPVYVAMESDAFSWSWHVFACLGCELHVLFSLLHMIHIKT